MKSIWASIVLLICSQGAMARGLLPFGNDEAFMANSGTALVGSPMGVYYNPAILGTVEDTTVSGSSSNFYLISVSGTNGNINSFDSVPSTLVLTWRLGSGSFGVSLLTPGFLDIDSALAGSIGGHSYQIGASSSQSENLVGASWGQSIYDCGDTCQLLSGFSLFFNYSTAKSTVQSYVSQATGTEVQAGQLSGTLYSLKPIWGLLWKASDKWSWGMRVEFPSILLRTSTSGMEITQSSDNSSGPTVSTAKITTPATNLPNIELWAAAIGFQWQASPAWTLNSDWVLAERDRSLDGSNGRIHAFGSASIGASYRLTSTWALLGGVMFDLQNELGPFAATETQYVAAMVSAGVKWKSNALESSVGLFDMRNLGVQQPAADPNAINSYNFRSENIFGLMVSGLYRFK